MAIRIRGVAGLFMFGIRAGPAGSALFVEGCRICGCHQHHLHQICLGCTSTISTRSRRTMATVDSEFPGWALLPKRETGVTSFLCKYPEYDGRGVTIAVMDSGVDPGAPGLQITTDGKRKIVETYDCSGAGDVDISTIVQAKDGEIMGLTGRKLKIPPSWKNPSGNYHIGLKNVYELYTSQVKDRVEKERKERLWDPHHKLAIAEINRKIQEFEKDHPQKSSLKGEDKLKREDLDAQLEILLEAEKKYSGVGPCYDCVVFNDGDIWRVCVDSSETGDLASCKLIGEYSKTYEYAQLTPSDQVNFSVNVWDEGKTLEIVCVCSIHGTHVAAIASAHFPENLDKNGVAPGAQIISLGIGDFRLTSMETGSALARAMIRIMQNKTRKVHVINMSYGEHPHYSISGRVIELMHEVVDKYGPIWVNSAANHGPALSTIGTPPDTNSNIMISAGAYVSPEMMTADYSLRSKMPGTTCTWSSCGPCQSGDPGVTVCAPGAAITSVPKFTLRSCQLMNGTSMSSPHVCGIAALLVSGLLQRNLPYSPYSVKRALENTAQFLPHVDEFGQGHGLVQVEKAFEHLATFHSQPERNVRFSLSCGSQAMRGIYLRDRFREKPEDITVSIDPIFFNTSNTDSHPDKTNFTMQLVLTCNKSWVSHPSHLCLMNMSRSISVRIDPTSLSPGVHTASVKAFDSSCLEKGPVFFIPITVVQPVVIPSQQHKKELVFTSQCFKPAQIQRHFILVPDSATWAVIRLLSTERGNFKIHTVQLRPHKSCKVHEYVKIFTVSPNTESVHSFAVRGGVILEVVVAKYWTDLCESTINYSVSFYGVKPDRENIVMQASDGVFNMELKSGLCTEEIAPVAYLKNVVTVCRPTESKIVPLSPTRDVIPPGRQIYELQLTYSFHVNRANDVSPTCPWLSHLLYESEFESQLWMLFNSSKQHIASGDSYADQSSTKLEKGDYTIRMHIRHERQDLLEKFTDKPMLISQKLPSMLSLDVYGSEGAAVSGGRKLVSQSLALNQVQPIYIPPLNNEKISKAAQVGQYLVGAITFAKDELGKKACSYNFRYILPDPFKKNNHSSSSKSNSSSDSSSKDSSNSSSTSSASASTGNVETVNSTSSVATKEKDLKEKPKLKYDEYQESLLDFKINALSKLERGEQADALYEELRAANPDNLSIHLAMVTNLKGSLVKFPFPVIGEDELLEDVAAFDQVVSVTNTIIEQVDQYTLLAYYGMKMDVQQDAAKVKTQMDRQKTALVDALCLRGVVFCRHYLANSKLNVVIDKDAKEKSPSTITLEDIDLLWRDVLRFVEQKDSVVQSFMMWHALAHGHLGRLIKLMVTNHTDKPSKETEHALKLALKAVGHNHWAKHIQDCSNVRFPPAYRLF